MTKIKYKDFGVASVVTSKNGTQEIWVNRALQKYPRLYARILKHELAHIKSGKDIDFKQDFINLFSADKELIKFCMENPSAFKELLPVHLNKGKKGREIIINDFACILFAIGILVLSIIILLVIS
jgi:hypothetical protein